MEKKNISFLTFLFILLFKTCILPDPSCKTLVPGDSELNTDYLMLYQIPITYLKYSTALGGDISKAFDNNWNSIWVSVPICGNNLPECVLEVVFENKVSINRMVYASEAGGKGFPINFDLYYAATESEEYTNKLTFVQAATGERVSFNFGKTVTAKKVKISIKQVATNHAWNARAKEIVFLQPENENSNIVLSLFGDYTQTSLSTNAALYDLDILDNSLKSNVNYEIYIKDIIERAKGIKSGAVTKDPKREFSTGSDAYWPLHRYGDVKGYSRGTLKMELGGTNRQLSGIYALAGEKITVYVEAPNQNDPLPYVMFSQIEGNFMMFYTNYNLHSLVRGKNILIAETINSAFPEVPKGGPIYIQNAYTEAQQSAQVKIYIEGGHLFPMYMRRESDVSEKKADFLNFLVSYYTEMKAQNYLDLCEIVGHHAMFTAEASRCYDKYILNLDCTGNGKDPQWNIVNWDTYIENLFKFDGLKYQENPNFLGENRYDPKNEHIVIHYRKAKQDTGAVAMATYDNIGIISWGWLDMGLCSKEVFGWGYAHETAHMMDIPERYVDETSNNMVSKYDETALMKEAKRGEYVATMKALSPNNVAPESRFKTPDIRANNYLIWWNIEAMKPGYWAEQENYYRYKSNINEVQGLSATEKQIYFGSKVTGWDLRYLYERWHYKITSAEKGFTIAQQSDKLRTEMAKLTLDNSERPLWYVDGPQYLFVTNGTNLDCYSTKSYQPVVKTLVVVKNKRYFIFEKSTCVGHLGFEIRNQNDVVGFTWDERFVDESAYSTEPVYTITAFDRNLVKSQVIEDVTVDKLKEYVCRIGDKKYYSIKEAVAEATSADTIYLLKDIHEEDITISKIVTITIDPAVSGDITIKRVGKEAHIFYIDMTDPAELRLYGLADNRRIVLDGDLIISNLCGIMVGSYSRGMEGKFLKFKNFIRYGVGSALCTSMYGEPVIYDTIFEDNVANHGGVTATGSAYTSLHLERCTFKNNFAYYNGGAVSITTSANIIDCTFTNNRAGELGGAVYASGTPVLKNFNTFEGNEAKNGGGFYIEKYTTDVPNKVIMKNNKALKGGAVYVNSAQDIKFKNYEIFENKAYEGAAIYIEKSGGFSLEEENTIKDNIILGEVDSSQDIVVMKNNFIIDGSLTLGGSIYKDAAASIQMKKTFSLSNSAQKIKFNLTLTEDIKTLMVSGNEYTLTDEDKGKFVLVGDAYELANVILDTDDNVIRTDPKPDMCHLNVYLGNVILETYIEVCGKSITINDADLDYDKNKFYIDTFTYNGNTFKGNDINTIKGVSTVVVNLKEYVYLTFDYSTNSVCVKFKFGEIYKVSLEQNINDFTINFYLLNENPFQKLYYENDEITMVRNITLLSIYKDAHIVSIVNLTSVLEAHLYPTLSNYVLPEEDQLTIPDSKIFVCWIDRLSNLTFEGGSIIPLTKDYVFDAVFADRVEENKQEEEKTQENGENNKKEESKKNEEKKKNNNNLPIVVGSTVGGTVVVVGMILLIMKVNGVGFFKKTGDNMELSDKNRESCDNVANEEVDKRASNCKINVEFTSTRRLQSDIVVY